MKFHHMLIVLLLLSGGMIHAQEDLEPRHCTEDEFEEVYDLVTEHEIIVSLDAIIEIIESEEAGENIGAILFGLYELRDTYMDNVKFYLPNCYQSIEFDTDFTTLSYLLSSNVSAFVIGTLLEQDDFTDYATSLNDQMTTHYDLFYLSWNLIEIVGGE